MLDESPARAPREDSPAPAPRALDLSGVPSGAPSGAPSGSLGDIRALGRVSDGELRALYDGALCLLFPSRYEGFGLPPLEAMWCGCPVLAGPAGAVPEVCGDAALYFDGDQPGSLAALIGRLADDPALRARLATGGRARAAAFSWEMAARRLLGFARA